MANQEQYELICEKAKKYDRLADVFDKIRAEMDEAYEEAYEELDDLDSHSLVIFASRMAEILDRYKAESEDKE